MPAAGTNSHRTRSILRHTTARRGPRKIEWASENQHRAFNHGPSPLLLSGGQGAGKTAILALKAMMLSDLYPKNRGVIARRVWDELRKTTVATFFKFCPPEAYRYSGRRNDNEKIVELNNGSEILWLHLDDPETENVIRGLEINWFLLDQAEEIEEEIFDLLIGRLGRWDKAEVPMEVMERHQRRHGTRWPHWSAEGKPIPPSYAMMTCNPDTELHWLYRRFHPRSPEHWEKKIPAIDKNGQPTGILRSYHDLGYTLIQMDSRDNKFLSRDNVSQLMAHDESYIRRFVRGEWGVPEGLIHDVSEASLVPGTPELVEHLTRTCTLHRTLDHGDASPTCCLWWAVDRDGNCFCYREYYMPNALISEHRQSITAMSAGEHYVFNLADPSIFLPTQQKHGGRWCVDDEYRDCRNLPRENALFWQKADNNEMGTRNRISEYLRVDPTRVNPITKERGAPRLYFLTKTDAHPQGCFHAIRELRSQRRKRLGVELGRPIFSDERDQKMSDHAYDALRYFIASRPPVAGGQGPKAKSERSWSYIHRQLQRFRQMGGYRQAAARAALLTRRVG